MQFDKTSECGCALKAAKDIGEQAALLVLDVRGDSDLSRMCVRLTAIQQFAAQALQRLDAVRGGTHR